MNTAKLDFKRFCVLVCILFLSSFVYAAADTLPVAADFSKTQTQNSAVYFSPDDFKLNVTAEDGEVTMIQLLSLPDRGSLTYQGAPVTDTPEIPIENAGELLYTPEQDAVYTTTFQYQAKTTGQYSKVATISISITDVTSGAAARRKRKHYNKKEYAGILDPCRTFRNRTVRSAGIYDC